VSAAAPISWNLLRGEPEPLNLKRLGEIEAVGRKLLGLETVEGKKGLRVGGEKGKRREMGRRNACWTFQQGRLIGT